MSTQPKQKFFSRIETREDALAFIKQASIGFFVVAAIQGGLGWFIAPSMLYDAAFYAILAAILMKWKSRVAAVFLMLFAVPVFVVTILNRLGIIHEGGNNIILAAIVAFTAIRAVEATFKLHGRFRFDAKPA